jgi:hypothetical protein
VLVAWSDEGEVPDLKGRVAGVGGSAAATRAGHDWFVTGSVILDGADLADVVQRRTGRAQVRAVIMHEFGHLLGLDHVRAADELMHVSNVGMTAFGPGDRAGLAALGSGECVDW